jgi:hypothetical protein
MGGKRRIDLARISNLKKGIQSWVTSKRRKIDLDEKENVPPVCVSC